MQLLRAYSIGQVLESVHSTSQGCRLETLSPFVSAGSSHSMRSCEPPSPPHLKLLVSSWPVSRCVMGPSREIDAIRGMVYDCSRAFIGVRLVSAIVSADRSR